MTVAIGTKLDRYEVRVKIGEGEMGEVYLVCDAKLPREVATQGLPAHFASDRC
jgi:serine/threonine protein kinase